MDYEVTRYAEWGGLVVSTDNMEGTTSSSSQPQQPFPQQPQSRLGWLAEKLLNPLGTGSGSPFPDEHDAAAWAAGINAQQAALPPKQKPLAERLAEAEDKVRIYQCECRKQHRIVEEFLDSLSDDHDIHVTGKLVPSKVEGVLHKFASPLLEEVVNEAAERREQALEALRAAVEGLGIVVVERKEVDLTRPRFEDEDDESENDADDGTDDEDEDDEDDESESEASDDDDDDDEDETQLAAKYEYKTVFELHDPRHDEFETENAAQAHELAETWKMHRELASDHQQLQEEFRDLREEKTVVEDENDSLHAANCKLREQAQQAYHTNKSRTIIEDLRARLDATEAERVSADTYCAAFQGQVGQLRGALVASQQRQELAVREARKEAEARTQAAATKQLRMLQQVHQNLRVTAADLQTRLGTAEGKNKTLAEELAGEREKHQRSVTLMQNRETVSRRQQDAMRTALNARSARLEEANRQLSQQLHNLKQTTQKKIPELEDQVEKGRQDCIVLQNDVGALRAQIRHKDSLLEQRAAWLKESEAAREAALAEAEGERKQKLEARDDALYFQTELEEAGVWAEQELEEHVAELEGLREELAEEREGRAEEVKWERELAGMKGRQVSHLEGRLREADHQAVLLIWAVEELREENATHRTRVSVLEGQVDYLRWRRTGTYAVRAQQQGGDEQGVSWEHIEDVADRDNDGDSDSDSDVQAEEGEDEDGSDSDDDDDESRPAENPTPLHFRPCEQDVGCSSHGLYRAPDQVRPYIQQQQQQAPGSAPTLHSDLPEESNALMLIEDELQRLEDELQRAQMRAQPQQAFVAATPASCPWTSAHVCDDDDDEEECHCRRYDLEGGFPLPRPSSSASAPAYNVPVRQPRGPPVVPEAPTRIDPRELLQMIIDKNEPSVPTLVPATSWYGASQGVPTEAAAAAAPAAQTEEENVDAKDEDEEEDYELDFVSLPELSEDDEEDSDSDESFSLPSRPVTPGPEF
ncbi:hypothetical protein PG984_011916 [Apiospora sp. TS-2023a]